jgi:hypothetical protein
MALNGASSLRVMVQFEQNRAANVILSQSAAEAKNLAKFLA